MTDHCARPVRRRAGGDAGTTLIELLVAMVIMAVVGALFAGTIVQVYRVGNTVDTTTQAQAQVRLAVQRLDREVRYAYGITTPTTVAQAAADSGTWYVEFLGVDKQSGARVCSQLRLKTGQLFERDWPPGTQQSAGQGWTALASDIDMTSFATPANPGGPVPFDLQAAGSTPYTPAAAVGSQFSPAFQRLRLRLVTVVDRERASSDVTFTALNTARTTDDTATGPTAADCQQQGRPQQ